MKSKLLSFSIALLASLCLWLYVVTVVNPEGTTTIYGLPVTFSGEEELRTDQNLIITEGANSTVNLNLSGKRSMLQKLKSKPDSITVMLDVSRIKKVGEYNMSYSVLYPSGVADSDITEVDRSPNSISFTVERLASKPIEVKGVFDGDVAEGYMADPMSFNYSEITIDGPESLVNSVNYAQVILTGDNLSQTVTMSVKYQLIGMDGEPIVSDEITANVDEIEATLPVLQYKEIPLTVEFLAGGGATENDVVCEISPQTITVAGDPALLDENNQIVLGKIDLGELTGDEEVTMPIAINNKLRNVSGDETAVVSVKIRGLETKVIRASNIAITNVPSGYNATSMTQMLQVTVRAPSGEIGKISADHLRVVADLSAAKLTKEGSYTVPVTISVDGFDSAGVIGDYTIVVSLSRE